MSREWAAPRSEAQPSEVRAPAPQGGPRTGPPRSEAQPSGVRAPARLGFTLLEVLAAAVIMAAVYAVLSASNIDATILEGDADRRLHASLVADRALVDVQAQLALGTAPRLGVSESEEDGYAVRVDLAPLELPFETWLPEPEGAPARDARAPSLLAPVKRGGTPPLLQLQILVSWSDGVRDRELRRTTFILDAATAAGVLAQAGVSETPPPEANP